MNRWGCTVPFSIYTVQDPNQEVMLPQWTGLVTTIVAYWDNSLKTCPETCLQVTLDSVELITPSIIDEAGAWEEVALGVCSYVQAYTYAVLTGTHVP